MTSRRSLCASAVMAGVVTLSAQTPRPTFEVASVRKHDSTQPLSLPGSFPNVRRGGVFSPTNITVSKLVLFAYDLMEFQMVGGPDWIGEDLFAINARAGGEAPTEQIRLMVRSLLEDRFRLVARMEQREMKFLALRFARSDRSLGPYLQRLPDDCNAASAREAATKLPRRNDSTRGGANVTGRCSQINLANVAAREMGTPVLDQTGLTGKWNLDLSFAPGARATDVNANLASFPVALEEQLGLKR